MQTIKIDEEFRTLIPPLTDDEFQRLEKSILAEGVREPIVTWNGTIIDGHNRYRICEKHGLEFRTTEREFESRDAAKIWIYGNQLGRRNLETGQKAALVIERNEAKVREAARLRQTSSLKQNQEHHNVIDRRGQQSPTEHEPEKGRTAEILAKQAGVGEATIKRVLKVKRENPELYSKVRSGDVSTHSAYRQVAEKESQTKQRVKNASKFADDGNRICSICGKPIENGMHYQDKKNWHYQCGLDHAMEIQRKYRDADSDLRENVPVFNTESLFAELEASAEMLRDSWLSSIEINESMGVKLTEQNKNKLEQATKNLFDTIYEIRKDN